MQTCLPFRSLRNISGQAPQTTAFQRYSQTFRWLAESARYIFFFSFAKVIRVCLHWEHLHNLLGEGRMTLRMHSVSWKICSSFHLVAILFAWANPNVLHSCFPPELVLKILWNVMASKRTSEALNKTEMPRSQRFYRSCYVITRPTGQS